MYNKITKIFLLEAKAHRTKAIKHFNARKYASFRDSLMKFKSTVSTLKDLDKIDLESAVKLEDQRRVLNNLLFAYYMKCSEMGEDYSEFKQIHFPAIC